MTKTKTINKNSLEIINNYLKLPFPDKKVSCPYFNNKKTKLRLSLHVLIGKGTPEQIVEEAKLIALRQKIDLKKISNENLKKFLIDNNLGIDCSGFVYHVLSEEVKIKKNKSLNNNLYLPHINFIKVFLLRIRKIVSSVDVLTLAHKKNSQKIKLGDLQPGDFISIIGYGKDNNRDHVVLIYKIDYENNSPKILHYTHSLQWETDGQYNHGVRQGIININDINQDILAQTWIEKEKQGDDNETYVNAKNAQIVELRRLKLIEIQ